MAEIEVNDLMSIGVIQDEPGYQIPPEGWTLGQNVRYLANGVEMLPGWSPTLGINPRGVPAAPAAPVLSQVAGGAFPLSTFFVKVTYVNVDGETTASAESSLVVAANNFLVVASPIGSNSATSWNVYVSTNTGIETKQNASPIALGTNFTQNFALLTGANPPLVNTTFDTPMALMYISSATQPWWLWASLLHIYVFDGVNDTDITRAVGGNYAAVDAKSWNGTLFQGVPILNDGIDKPQFWANYSAGQKMQDLTNWPANFTSRVVRSFLSYMFALNNTSSGVNLPHQVRWSNAAVPGSLPSTWDFTDPTNDAGSTDLPDVASGRILDGQELQGQFFIYKEASTWRVQFIGSPFVFSFHSFMENTGILASRCLAITADGRQHVVATQDDILVHNGISSESLLSKRMRRYLFNRIDPSTFDTSFMFNNPVYDEIWFCYPSNGAAEPDSALIWNYKYNSFTEATGIDFRAAEIGTIPVTGQTWAQQTLTWAQDSAQWATSKRRRIAVCNPNTKKLILLDDTGTVTRDGVTFTGIVQRTGLSITGQKRNGEWVVDLKNQKMIRVLWPKIQAQNTVQIRVGYAQLINGNITWNPYQTFDPDINLFVEGCEGQGRSISVEFRGQTGWRLDGYKLDLEPLGEF